MKNKTSKKVLNTKTKDLTHYTIQPKRCQRGLKQTLRTTGTLKPPQTGPIGPLGERLVRPTRGHYGEHMSHVLSSRVRKLESNRGQVGNITEAGWGTNSIRFHPWGNGIKRHSDPDHEPWVLKGIKPLLTTSFLFLFFFFLFLFLF